MTCATHELHGHTASTCKNVAAHTCFSLPECSHRKRNKLRTQGTLHKACQLLRNCRFCKRAAAYDGGHPRISSSGVSMVLPFGSVGPPLYCFVFFTTPSRIKRIQEAQRKNCFQRASPEAKAASARLGSESDHLFTC